MFRSRTCGSQRRRFAGAGALALVATVFTVVAAPADAARQITPPPNYFCGDYYSRTISIIPPRVWSSYNRPEQVAWVTQIERWNYVRREWYNYGAQFRTWSTFNWYGQSLTSWGHRFVNSKLNLPVSHPGYYRVGVSIGGTQGGVRWTGYIGGPNARCYMS
jgi:hypothetical protein